MARARNMKPGYFTNEDLADCGVHAHLLFGGLWTIADRSGRLEDRPRRIKIQLMPFYEIDVDNLLSALESSGFIIRYEVEGQKYIQIINFEKHQNPHVKEPASTIPAPCLNGADSGISGTSRADSLNPLTLTLNPLTATGADAPTVIAKRFSEFWEAYPKKKSKGDAEKAWRKIKPNEQLHEAILRGVEQAKTSADWQKDGGQYIPYPATWLNARGWEDEEAKPQTVRRDRYVRA